MPDAETKFVSSEDIEKGTAWFPKIATELKKSDFGIVCLTPENLQSRWVHFEAGALAGTFSQKKTAPLLFGFKKTEQIPPPLSELNMVMFEKQDFYKLLKTLNKYTEKPISEGVLSKAFERSWEHISEKIKEQVAALPKSVVAKRSSDEILEEILSLTRSHSWNNYEENQDAYTERFVKMCFTDGRPLSYKGERMSVAQAMSRLYDICGPGSAVSETKTVEAK